MTVQGLIDRLKALSPNATLTLRVAGNEHDSGGDVRPDASSISITSDGARCVIAVDPPLGREAE